MQITTEKNQMFGVLSGDYNPVHFDSKRMANTHYGKPIANGIQTLSCIGSAIVDMFVTKKTLVIAIEQHNSFLKPVFIDDKITATVTVITPPNMQPMRGNEYWLSCLVNNQDDECVLSSTFRVRVIHA
jgi:3-hydroxybutyryl-CoA dehydratase